MNGFFRFSRGTINEIGPRHDTVMFNEVEGFFDLSGFYGLVQFPPDLFGTALDAETDLDATGFSHPSKEIGLDMVDACDGDPCDMEPSVDNFLTDGLNPLLFVCEGVIGKVEKMNTFPGKQIQLIHEITGRVGANPGPPETGGAAESAVAGAAPGKGHMLELKITGRIGELIQVFNGFGWICFLGPPLMAKSNAGNQRDFIMSACVQGLNELQKGNFPLAENDIIDVVEMGQQVIPQKCSPDAAENDFNVRVQIFGDFCNVDAAPSIGVEDGKSNNVRAFFFDCFGNDVRSMIYVVPVADVDIVAVFFQLRSHIIDADGGYADLIGMDPLVEKIGINQ